MKIFLFLFLTIAGFYSNGQIYFQLEANAGLTYPNNVTVNRQKLNNTKSISTQIGAFVSIPVYSNFFIKTGLRAKYYINHYYNEDLEFKSHKLNPEIPFLIGLTIIKNVKVSTGISIENNLDYEDIDFEREIYNLRYNYLIQLSYQINHNLLLTINHCSSITKIPNIYSISNPPRGLYAGIIFQFNHRKR